MDKAQLQKVLDSHKQWLDSYGAEGERAALADAHLAVDDLEDADLRYADLRKADLRSAYLVGADLRYTNLRGANLRKADLRKANLRYADLEGAFLKGALVDLSIPVVPMLHTQMLARIEALPESFDMSCWHSVSACGTTHCRAGFAIDLAGQAGYELESRVGSAVAGALITQVSCPWLDQVPDWVANNKGALADIRACAAREAQEHA
jgi:hypothetical protein